MKKIKQKIFEWLLKRFEPEWETVGKIPVNTKVRSRIPGAGPNDFHGGIGYIAGVAKQASGMEIYAISETPVKLKNECYLEVIS